MQKISNSLTVIIYINKVGHNFCFDLLQNATKTFAVETMVTFSLQNQEEIGRMISDSILGRTSNGTNGSRMLL